jgi:hypothetical protein
MSAPTPTGPTGSNRGRRRHSGIFAATGQTRIAGSRLLIQGSVYDQASSYCSSPAGSARMGDPPVDGHAGRAGDDAPAVRQGAQPHPDCQGGGFPSAAWRWPRHQRYVRHTSVRRPADDFRRGSTRMSTDASVATSSSMARPWQTETVCADSVGLHVGANDDVGPLLEVGLDDLRELL